MTTIALPKSHHRLVEIDGLIEALTEAFEASTSHKHKTTLAAKVAHLVARRSVFAAGLEFELALLAGKGK